jgi:hypothetical protein
VKQNIRSCLEQHLPEKAKPGNLVAATVWFDAAESHLRSARAISSDDPGGAFMLGWASMHKTAKGIAAIGGCRIEGETHGKVVDFICCVFSDLSNGEKGLVRLASTGRNTLSYDDPSAVDTRLRDDVLSLANRLLAAARAGVQPHSIRKIPPPPSR